MKSFLKVFVFLSFSAIVLPALIALQANAAPVRRLNSEEPSAGMQGRTVALWGSHGNYFNEARGEWVWQRPHLFETIEDLFTTSFVTDLLAPMLENAGAYVMMPRERDASPIEIIIDGDHHQTEGYAETDNMYNWCTSSAPGFKWMERLEEGDNPFTSGELREIQTVVKKNDESTASWNAWIPERGEYTVYISYASMPNSASSVTYTVNSLRGREEFVVDQTMGGGTWIRLGEFPLEEGLSEMPLVSVSNVVPVAQGGKVITADAVKIGGGMGNVLSPMGEPSGLPRWAEGARYWLQWAGFPRQVWISDKRKDSKNPHYLDDLVSRPQWVNYLTGGSSSNPKAKGLKIPVDVALALHSDAGVTEDDSYIGTLALYTVGKNGRLADGRSRNINKTLAEKVLAQITGDLQTLYDANWPDRGARNKNYAESRIPEVPVVLIEMLSHQNYADMKLAQNPQFKFDMARALYKGLGRFLAGQKKQNFIVQPLPVNNFSIVNLGEGRYRLSWKPTDDPIEPSAAPTGYIVERRIADGAFSPVATVETPNYIYNAKEGEITSFRIIARNSGGRSFPSEVLALCHIETFRPEVLIVNGFTRLSAPYSFANDSTAGFLNHLDYGVAYNRNIGFVGAQVDHRRDSEYEDDYVNPGFGGSLATNEGYPVAGNTFDYVALHGSSAAMAGYPFVSTSMDAYIENSAEYNRAKVIDFIFGAQRETQPGVAQDGPTKFKIFTPELQMAIKDYRDRGGNLFISGANICNDIYANSFSNDSTYMSDAIFASDILNMNYDESGASSSGRLKVAPVLYNDYNSGSVVYANAPSKLTYAVAFGDALKPAQPKNVVKFAAHDDSGAAAGLMSREGESSIALLGVPFEIIDDADNRDFLMKEILLYLSPVRFPMRNYPSPDDYRPRKDAFDFRPLLIPSYNIEIYNPDDIDVINDRFVY